MVYIDPSERELVAPIMSEESTARWASGIPVADGVWGATI